MSDPYFLEYVREFAEIEKEQENIREQFEGNLLHECARRGHLPAVKYLIEDQQYDPICVNFDGETPLYCAYEAGHDDVVKYLIEEMTFVPNHADYQKLAKDLIDNCMPRRSFSKTYACLPDTRDVSRRVLQYSTETIYRDTNCVDRNGRTPFQWALMCGHVILLKHLIETCHCDPESANKDGKTPLHWACMKGSMKVVQYLCETCHCDAKSVDKDGRSSLRWACMKGHMEVVQYLIERCHCDVKSVDKDGRNPLHWSSMGGHTEIVQYLLRRCNPNCKDKDGCTPIDLAVDHPAVARALIKAGAKSTHQPFVKIFIVGNPSAGKSSLTKALQTETSMFEATLASITGRRLVSGVEEKTAGIVPCQFNSKRYYGNVIFYDFAGQQEYYASHAALLQNLISSHSAALFIIVVNLCDSEEEIKQKLIYWISFLANQCTSVTTKPHVIIVGSHSDVVRSMGGDPRVKVNMEFLQAAHVSSGFHISNFIPMDCRQSNSHDIVKLAQGIKEICDVLRKQVDVSAHSHILFVFLLERFRGVSAVALKEVLHNPYTSHEVVPKSAKSSQCLHIGCRKLHETGHIIYIENLIDLIEGWIILDEADLLSQVNGVLFAPEEFKQHCCLANATGVVPVSRLAQAFPHHNVDMLVQFLSHLEFCREVHDVEVVRSLCSGKHLPQTDQKSERFLFFSGLVSVKPPDGVWDSNPQFPLLCGWMLQCCKDDQFFTSQFTQVLLLRIASLAPDNSDSIDLPLLLRKCHIWKSGIKWASRKGVEALVKIRDPPQNKEVVVMLRCWSGQEVECACIRSSIIQIVMKVKRKLCPLIPAEEFILHPCQVKEYPSAKQGLISMIEVSRAIEEGAPGVVNSNVTCVDLKELLLFEPYANITADILQQLFSGETSCF